MAKYLFTIYKENGEVKNFEYDEEGKMSAEKFRRYLYQTPEHRLITIKLIN